MPNSEKRPPVMISINVEFPGGSESDVHEVDRDEWDAMTPAERKKLAEEVASDHAANYVGWGWNIDDPADYAATDEQAAVDTRPQPAELVHGLRKGGESWCGGHHVRASLKRETVTCPDCLTAMDTAPKPSGGAS